MDAATYWQRIARRSVALVSETSPDRVAQIAAETLVSDFEVRRAQVWQFSPNLADWQLLATVQRSTESLAPDSAAPVILPLTRNDQLTGVLSCDCDRAVPDDVLEVLETYADLVSVALARSMPTNPRPFRQLQTAELRFQAILESAPDPIVITDGDGRIVLINHQAESTFGYPQAELLGKAIELLLPLPSRERHERLRDEYRTHPRTRPMGTGLRLLAQRKNGSEFPVEVSLSPLLIEEEFLVISSVRDVTGQRDLERQKDAFLANVSHDLRTPLTAIKASIGVVLANEPAGLPEPLHRMLVNVEQAADRMSILVADLLELTRLQAGRAPFHPRRCDVRELALRAAQAVEPLAKAHGQRLALDLPSEPLIVMAEPERLERALLNLLRNAQKSGREGGDIGLRLEEQSEAALFSVVDDGPGVPESELSHVFERFYRSETEAFRCRQGSGLGLPIAKAVVELHRGHLWAESRPGYGVAFHISIPKSLERSSNPQEVLQ